MLDVFKSPVVKQELVTPLVGILTELVTEAMGCLETECSKIFKKSSYIGRRIIGDRDESSDAKLLGLLNLY
jgi:hypothetical protein